MSNAAVTAGQFGNWAPIGAEKTASGYEVAWKVTGTDQYGVLNTDNAGNFVSNPIGEVSGSSVALQSLEPSFQQDLNGDGTVGLQDNDDRGAGIDQPGSGREQLFSVFGRRIVGSRVELQWRARDGGPIRQLGADRCGEDSQRLRGCREGHRRRSIRRVEHRQRRQFRLEPHWRGVRQQHRLAMRSNSASSRTSTATGRSGWRSRRTTSPPRSRRRPARARAVSWPGSPPSKTSWPSRRDLRLRSVLGLCRGRDHGQKSGLSCDVCLWRSSGRSVASAGRPKHCIALRCRSPRQAHVAEGRHRLGLHAGLYRLAHKGGN